METKKVLSFFTLFTSMSTLLCCALPALLVSVGLGAVMAGLSANVPGLIWVSENKIWVFSIAGLLLAANGLIIWANRNAPCPTDPKLRDACLSGRKWARNVYIVSAVIFLIGLFFAYLAPMVL